MVRNSVVPAVVFMMKYFFDVEKEITQQILLTFQVRIMDCKEILHHIQHILVKI